MQPPGVESAGVGGLSDPANAASVQRERGAAGLLAIGCLPYQCPKRPESNASTEIDEIRLPPPAQTVRPSDDQVTGGRNFLPTPQH